jgi:hypothetical protein
VIRPYLEALEDRVLPTTVQWTNPAGGAGSVAGNWSTGAVPGAADDVVINPSNPASNFAVTYSNNSDTVHSLTASNPFTLSGGTLAVTDTVQSTSTFTLAGGTLASATVLSGTTITGTGSGGSAAGTLTVTGTYTQTSAGALNIDLGGLTPGGLFDQLSVWGAATLDGTLNVAEINRFTPSNGDTFPVVVAASRTGQFATANGLVGNHVLLVANYPTTGVTLVSEQPGIRVSPTTGLQTSQAGASASFTVVLDSQPTGNVTIGISSSNTSAGAVSTSQLVFTPQNWNIPQTVTVTGVNDFMDDGDQVYAILTAPAVSADPTYNGFDPSDVTVTNLGTNQAGFAITPTTGLQTSQAGASATFTVALTSKPATDVHLALISSNPSAGTASSGSLTFTAQNWSTPQTVTVTGVNDQLVDGDVAYTILTGPAVSTDPRYNQFDPPDVAVTNLGTNLLDLQPVNLAVSPTAPQSGQTVTVSWADTLTGNVSTPRGFNDNVAVTHITTGATLVNATVAYDPSAAGNGPIQPGQSRNRQFTFTLPDGTTAVGQLRITVTTNAGSTLREANASGTASANNSATVTVVSALAQYPDLQVANLTMTPADAPAGLQSGATVALAWDDQSTGPGDTTDNGTRPGSFYDSVLVQQTDAHGTVTATLFTATVPAGALAAGASAHRQSSFRLPDGAAGTGNLRVTVTADYLNNVFESNSGGTAETNNTATLTATVGLAPYADLRVTNLAVSPSSGLRSGDSLTVAWSDSNTGTATVSAAFFDRVTVVNTTTGQTLTSSTVPYDPATATNGAIAAGDARARQFSFTLPPGTAGAGSLQVTVAADTFNQVFESNTASTAESNNSATVTASAALAPYADLVASNVTAPTLTVGDPAQVTVGWTVTDLDTGPGTVSTWVDSVIASPDDDPTHGSVLAQFPHTGLLSVGSSYTQSQTFPLPPGSTTHSHLFVRTDAGDVVFENGNEANNCSEAPGFFDVVPIPYADLAVSAVTADATAGSGRPLSVTWTVSNVSPHALGSTNTGQWSDLVSLATDPAGQNVVATFDSFDHIGALAVGGSYTRTASVTLPVTLPAGTYYVVVRTSGPFEFIYTDNNTAVSASPVTVTQTPPPDLTPTRVAAVTPGSTAEVALANAGDRIDVTWTVQNAGTGDATGLWDDVLQLRQVGGTAVYGLGTFDYQGPLQAGRSYTRTEQVQLPAHVQGVFQVVVQTNAGFPPIFENGATANNTFADPDALTLALPPSPDLQVFSLDAPATASAGGTVALDFTVINQGTAEARGQWTDNVYLSLKNPLDGSAILLGQFGNGSALPPGQVYQTHTPTLAVPGRLGGQAYLIVAANANGAVDEFPHGDNNTLVRPITVNPEPPADLVTGNVTAPDQAFDGSTITVSYHVSNRGDAPTNVSSWTDTIWLTRDRKRPSTTKGDVLLATIPHNGKLGNDPSVLAPPTGYDVTMNVTLPKHLAGQFFLTPWSDSFDVVLKSTRDVNVNPDDPTQLNNDNYKARPLTVLLTPPPDLQVATVTAAGPDPAQPGHVLTGQNFTVTYTAANRGAGDTPDRQSAWDDYVYLSRDQFLSDADTFFTTVHHTGGLAANGSCTSTVTLKAPRGLTGPWYVFVITDPPTASSARGAVFEGTGESNNATPTATPLRIDQPPPADLQVTTITAPGSALSGSAVEITWTVTNTGDNPASGSWTDTAYLSSDSSWDIGDLPIGTVTFSGTVAGHGGTYTATLDANLPPATPGQYRILVRADVFDEVIESSEFNTTTSADVLSVTVPELHLGVPLATTLDAGQDRLYQVTVRQGDTLRVELTSPSTAGANELFLRYGALPTGSTYDAAYQGPLQANQFAVIPSTTAGVYYVLVHGQSEPVPGTPVTLLASVLPFEITDVIPDTGGDSRYVTTIILGAQFDPHAIVKLVRPGIAEHEPVSYQVMDRTRIVATFDFTSAPHGLYDVEVINPDGAVALAPDRHLVETALPPDVSIALGGPPLGGPERAVRVHPDQHHERRYPLRLSPVRRARPASEREGPLSWVHREPARQPERGRRALGGRGAGGERRRRGARQRLRGRFRRPRQRESELRRADLPRRPARARGGQPAGADGLRLPHHGRRHPADARRVPRPADAVRRHATGQHPRRPDGVGGPAGAGRRPNQLDQPLPPRLDPGGPAAGGGRAPAGWRCPLA